MYGSKVNTGLHCRSLGCFASFEYSRKNRPGVQMYPRFLLWYYTFTQQRSKDFLFRSQRFKQDLYGRIIPINSRQSESPVHQRGSGKSLWNLPFFLVAASCPL